MKDLAELQTKTFRIYSADSGNLLLRIPCISSAIPRREERFKKKTMMYRRLGKNESL